MQFHFDVASRLNSVILSSGIRQALVDRENEIYLPSMRVRAVAQLVEALHYEVPVSIPGYCPWKYSSDCFLPSKFSSLGVHSDSNRNFLGVIKCGRRVELTGVTS